MLYNVRVLRDDVGSIAPSDFPALVLLVDLKFGSKHVGRLGHLDSGDVSWLTTSKCEFPDVEMHVLHQSWVINWNLSVLQAQQYDMCN